MDTPKHMETPDAYKVKYDIARAQLRATEDLYTQRAMHYEQALQEARREQDALRAEVASLRQKLSFVRQAEPPGQPATHTLTLTQVERYAIGSRSKAQAEAIVSMLNETLPMDVQRTEAVERIRHFYDKSAQAGTTIGVLNNHGSMNDFHDNQLYPAPRLAVES